MNHSDRFRVVPGRRVKLTKLDPGYDGHGSHRRATKEIEADQKKLRDLQDLFHADGRLSLLLCLQGLDTGGKDGTINHVLGTMNPQGCRVVAFREPSVEELAHDFLWRAHQAAPRRGEVVVFNRSHYEDVLVVRVHQLVEKSVWSKRFDQINAFEHGLAQNHTHILKFFLHLSPEEQLKRFEKRLDDPAKQWKISEADYRERKHWSAYTEAYEDVLSRCSTEHAPWFVIPSDHKWFRNLAISRILVEYLEGLRLKYPKASVDIEHIRREYHAAKKRE